MRWLSERVAKDERGVAVLLLALTIVVLFAVAALVIDVGALHVEKRSLRNGADAAALAVAQACALGNCAYSSGLASAQAVADANAGDGTSTVEQLAIDPSGHSVTVTTGTRAPDGTTVVPSVFGRMITGISGYHLRATAVAQWGAPAVMSSLRLTISWCDWNAATAGGTAFRDDFSGLPTIVTFHGSATGVGSCTAVSGQDVDGNNRLTGGFGWVAGTGCSAILSADNWTGEDPGNSLPSSCDLAALVNTTVILPIFDDSNALGGSNGAYHIDGFAAFRLAGYRFPGNRSGSTPGCTGNQTCVAGFFTRVLTGANAIGGPSFGASAVVLTA